MIMKAKNMVGQVCGRLTVISLAGVEGDRAMWNCECTCGNQVVVQGTRLRNGGTKSCGCSRGEAGSANLARYRQSRPAKIVRPKGKVGRPRNPVNVDYVIELYNEGLSYRDIQEYIPINLRTLSRIINENTDKLTREQYTGGRPK